MTKFLFLEPLERLQVGDEWRFGNSDEWFKVPEEFFGFRAEKLFRRGNIQLRRTCQ